MFRHCLQSNKGVSLDAHALFLPSERASSSSLFLEHFRQNLSNKATERHFRDDELVGHSFRLIMLDFT
jgi:hypothetical protein